VSARSANISAIIQNISAIIQQGRRVRPVLAARHELLLRVLPPRVGRARGRRGAPQRRRHGDPRPDDLPAGARAQLTDAAQDSRPRVSHSLLLLPAPSIQSSYPLPLHAVILMPCQPGNRYVQVGRMVVQFLCAAIVAIGKEKGQVYTNRILYRIWVQDKYNTTTTTSYLISPQKQKKTTLGAVNISFDRVIC